LIISDTKCIRKIHLALAESGPNKDVCHYLWDSLQRL